MGGCLSSTSNIAAEAGRGKGTEEINKHGKKSSLELKLDSFKPNPEIGTFLRNVPLLCMFTG